MTKIYERLVFDIATLEVLEEESYEYEGPIAECKGGGSETNTVDYEYNARMATLSEEQQDWARSYYNFWEDEQRPLESAMIKSDLAEVTARQPVQQEFYKQSLDGIDVDARAASAGADVQHSYDGMSKQLVRDSARLGINPYSGKMASAMTSMGNQKVKDQAGAMNAARTQAQDDKYKRMTTAMGMSK